MIISDWAFISIVRDLSHTFLASIFGVTATISGLFSTVYAQSPQIEQVQTSFPNQQETDVETSNQLDNELDLTLSCLSVFIIG